MTKNIIMVLCLIVTIGFIWIWYHHIQFNDHSRQALFHLRRGELDQAIKEYTTAIKHKPKEPSAYNNLGQAYLGKAEYDKAVAAFKKALEIKPDAVEAYVNLATAYLKQDLPIQAIEACQAAIQIAPNLALAHYNLACAYALMGENEKAIDSLKRAIALDERLKAFASEERAFDGLRSHPAFPSE
jgi:tetratricopeptide (TPR) repeat protein